jgi:hypothetical protein
MILVRPRNVTVPLLAIGLGVALACTNGEDDEQFREEVFVCEEAVARLESCCPGFDARSVPCVFYRSTGCSGNQSIVRDPALDTRQADCILDSSCDQIRAADMCRRAAGLSPLPNGTTSSSGANDARSSSSGASDATSSSGSSSPRRNACP